MSSNGVTFTLIFTPSDSTNEGFGNIILATKRVARPRIGVILCAPKAILGGYMLATSGLRGGPKWLHFSQTLIANFQKTLEILYVYLGEAWIP